ncbi:MAG: hypothetical protein ACYC7J_16635 [Syntrophales bacterium]
MITGDMLCAYCGLTGKIDGSVARSGDGEAAVFRYRGYNPVSGHVHYQCPSCSIVQLVLPMDILDGKVASGFSVASGRGDFFGKTAAKALQRANELHKTLRMRLLPGNGGLVERRG